MKILLLAGEESGVLYAEQIKSRLKGHEVRGYGDYGFEVADLAVMGIGQVLKKLFYFIRVKRTMERAINDWKPDVVCTVDYPGMNLKLAAFAKSRGIRTVHVVCPQVWAWKQGRIPKIEQSLDSLCCFFPFEPRLFKPGFAKFVGHPLAMLDLQRQQHPPTSPLLAVLPGSRGGEIEKHTPTLLEVVRILRKRIGNLQVVIPAANDKAFNLITRLVGGEIEVVHGGARELLSRADCAVVASGTATLEAALARCPTVLVYRVGWMFAFIARRVIKGVKHIGLANVIWEKERESKGLSTDGQAPMPEFLQENFTAENVVGWLEKWLDDENARQQAISRLDETMKLLVSKDDAIGGIVKELEVNK